VGNDTQWLVGWLTALGAALSSVAMGYRFGVWAGVLTFGMTLLLAALSLLFASARAK
jgi:hypothetical protein